MAVEVLATLLGVALAALVAACGAGFRWLRSDFRDLRAHVDFCFEERIATTNAQFGEVNGRLDRLEAHFGDLIMALARSGSLIDPQPAAPRPPPLAPESTAAAQPLEPAPAPPEAPADGPLRSEPSSEIADPARAPPATSSQPSAEQPSPPPLAEPSGPTAQPAELDGGDSWAPIRAAIPWEGGPG